MMFDNNREIGYMMGYEKAIEKFKELCWEASYMDYKGYVVEMNVVEKIADMMKEGEY